MVERECFKNHSVSIGGHTHDGNDKFIVVGTEGTLEALKCATYNCHHKFHWKETATLIVFVGDQLYPFDHHYHMPSHFVACYRALAGYLHMAGPLPLPPCWRYR